MSEQPTYAQRIRAHLEAGAQAQDATAVAGLATEYADACRDANDRLRQCSELLRNGRRTEALAKAKEQPSLLDLIASLRLRDFAEWKRTCARNSWPTPPQLAMDLADELTDATAEAVALRPLLDQLETLTTNDAPLSDQLQVMRKLFTSDPHTPQWRIEVQEMEGAHLESVHRKAMHACQANELGEALEALDELGSSSWLNKPPMRIVQPLLDYVVPALLAQLATDQSNQNDAGARKTLQAAQVVKDRWTFAVPVLENEIPKGLLWLNRHAVRQEEYNVFRQRCDALRHELDSDAALDQLQRHQARATRFEWELPEELARHYEQVVGKKQRAILHARLRRRTAFGLTVAALIFAGLALLQHQHSESLAAEAIDRLNAAMVNYDWNEAREMWKTLLKQSPAIARRADVIAAHDRVLEAAQNDVARSKRLDELLQSMDAGHLGPRDYAVTAVEAKTLIRRPDEQARFDQIHAQ